MTKVFEITPESNPEIWLSCSRLLPMSQSVRASTAITSDSRSANLWLLDWTWQRRSNFRKAGGAGSCCPLLVTRRAIQYLTSSTK